MKLPEPRTLRGLLGRLDRSPERRVVTGIVPSLFDDVCPSSIGG